MRLRIALLLLLLFVITGPALAQGGTLNYGDNAVGSLSATAPLAFYTFSGAAGDLVTIQVIGITPGLDPAISLNSPTQQQLANNDNDPSSFGGTDARIHHTLPQNGIYTVLVSSVTGTPGDYLIRLSGQQAGPAAALSDAPTSADVAPGGQAQVFSFEANPTAPLALNVTGTPPEFGFRVVVHDASGQIVALLNGSGSVSITLPAGSDTYTVEVSGVDPNVPGQVTANIGAPASAPAAPPPPAQAEGTVPPPAETEEAAPPPQNDQIPAGVCMVGPQGNNVVNVRNGPSTDYGVIAQIPAGQQAEAVGIYSGWYLINLPGVGPGWVFQNVVTTAGTCNALPTANPPSEPAQTEEAAPPDQVAPDQPTATYTPTQPAQQNQQQLTATYTPSYTPTQPAQQQATATYTPSYTPTTPPAAQVAPDDARFNNPLTLQLDTTGSVTDFVSYPGGDREDRVRWDISGMNQSPSISGGRARLTLAVSCFGNGLENVQFFTGGQTYSCGQTVFDQEVTYDSRTGQLTITAVGGEGTYVQWVLTGTAVRVN